MATASGPQLLRLAANGEVATAASNPPPAPPGPDPMRDAALMATELHQAQQDGVASIVDAGLDGTGMDIQFIREAARRSGLPVVKGAPPEGGVSEGCAAQDSRMGEDAPVDGCLGGHVLVGYPSGNVRLFADTPPSQTKDGCAARRPGLGPGADHRTDRYSLFAGRCCGIDGAHIPVHHCSALIARFSRQDKGPSRRARAHSPVQCACVRVAHASYPPVLAATVTRQTAPY